MPEQTNVDVLSDVVCELGESAVWDGVRSRLYWVDITGRTVYAQDWPSRTLRSLAVPDTGRVRGAAGRRRPGRRPAPRRGVHRRRPGHGRDRSATLEADLAGQPVQRRRGRPARPALVRLDGPRRDTPTGSFYSFSADTTVTRAFGGIICSNGPAWSPDGRTMYHVDSTRRLITAYDFDADAGRGRARAGSSSPTRPRRGSPMASRSTPRATSGTASGPAAGSCATTPAVRWTG